MICERGVFHVESAMKKSISPLPYLYGWYVSGRRDTRNTDDAHVTRWVCFVPGRMVTRYDMPP